MDSWHLQVNCALTVDTKVTQLCSHFPSLADIDQNHLVNRRARSSLIVLHWLELSQSLTSTFVHQTDWTNIYGSFIRLNTLRPEYSGSVAFVSIFCHLVVVSR